MAVYAIGDVHACLGPLKELLATLDFHPGRDRLLFVGDLINRGPDSRDVLHFVQDLGDRAITIMGNHEAWALGGFAGKNNDFFQFYTVDLRDAPDLDELLSWMRALPLMHQEPEYGIAMVHAGLHPQWSIEKTAKRARALERVFRDEALFQAVLEQHGEILAEEDPGDGNAIDTAWFDMGLFTRIRMTTAEGRLLWPRNAKLAGLSPYAAPTGGSEYEPWHQVRSWKDEDPVILYGHWAAQRVTISQRAIGLDGGCVYGGELAAVRIDDPSLPMTRVSTPEVVVPDHS
ncbi:MAG: symmetrical bis(5'-nucleosyl)-tetraphosphatase [Magnetococcales bacterium]|nr:symmetrical bis(5'-nucleosyl)-tetraphosphatase [Magnetococcales bacterium]